VSLIYYVVVVSAETLFAFEGDFCGRVLVVCNTWSLLAFTLTGLVLRANVFYSEKKTDAS
jgi:hypothetical protein